MVGGGGGGGDRQGCVGHGMPLFVSFVRAYLLCVVASDSTCVRKLFWAGKAGFVTHALVRFVGVCVRRHACACPTAGTYETKKQAVLITHRVQQCKAAWKLLLRVGADPADFPEVRMACLMGELKWIIGTVSPVRPWRVCMCCVRQACA